MVLAATSRTVPVLKTGNLVVVEFHKSQLNELLMDAITLTYEVTKQARKRREQDPPVPSHRYEDGLRSPAWLLLSRWLGLRHCGRQSLAPGREDLLMAVRRDVDRHEESSWSGSCLHLSIGEERQLLHVGKLPTLSTTNLVPSSLGGGQVPPQKGVSVQLENQTALVTGSTSGIGRETALLLAEQGASVFVSGRSAAKGAETVAAIEAAGGKARFVAVDLGDLDSVRSLAEEVGEIDVLVNNAGAFPFAPTFEQRPDTFTTMFNTNVHGTYFLTQTLLKKMVAKGAGSVVNVTTIAGLRGIGGSSGYGASKAAIDSLTRTWAVEFGSSGVRINAVAPGHTRTENVVDMLGEENFEQLGRQVPLGRLASAREIAETIVFLASPRASYITGVTLPADGGFMALGLA